MLWVVGVLVALLVAFGVFVLWLAASLSGGLDDMFSGGGPAPDAPEVVAAGNRAADSLESDGRRLGRVAVPALPAGAAVVGSTASAPDCRVGQHNFKIDDSFDLTCRRNHRTVVAVPSPAGSLPAGMAALDAQLRAAGWASQQPMTMDRVLTEYWAPVGGQERPDGTGTRRYGVGDLPPAGYIRSGGADGDPSTRTLSVSWLDTGSVETDLTGYGDGTTVTRAGRPATAAEVLAAVPAGGYAVVLTESVEYFRA